MQLAAKVINLVYYLPYISRICKTYLQVVTKLTKHPRAVEIRFSVGQREDTEGVEMGLGFGLGFCCFMVVCFVVCFVYLSWLVLFFLRHSTKDRVF